MPKLSVPRSAKNIVGALILSITAAASHVRSARLTIAVTPSGIAASISIEASLWHSLRASSIRTRAGQLDGPRVCAGTFGACWANCGDIVIGPFSALGVTATVSMSSVRSGSVGLSCVDIRLGPMLEAHAELFRPDSPPL
jgi:hypothetical protein